jgi:hypothetical protein
LDSAFKDIKIEYKETESCRRPWLRVSGDCPPSPSPLGQFPTHQPCQPAQICLIQIPARHHKKIIAKKHAELHGLPEFSCLLILKGTAEL